VSADPLVDIGGDTDDIDYLFERIVGIVLLPNNTVAVADGGANQLRIYDSLGVIERVAGAPGSGPGEFNGLAQLFRYKEDSLVAYDYLNRRYSVFGPELTFARTFTVVSAEVPAAWPLSTFNDGSLLLKHLDITEASLSIVGPYRQAEVLYRYDPRSSGLEEIARLPGQEMISIPAPGSGWGDQLPLPFGKESAAGAFGDGFFTANSDTYEVRFFDRDRRLSWILRRVDFDATVSGAEERAARAYFDSAWGPPQHEASHGPLWLRTFDDMEFPESRPAFGRYFNSHSWPAIVADGQGNLWVLHYLPPGDEAEQWDVFDSAGAWLGTVGFPRRFTPIDMRPDRIAGVWRDADMADHVRVYALGTGT